MDRLRQKFAPYASYEQETYEVISSQEHLLGASDEDSLSSSDAEKGSLALHQRRTRGHPLLFWSLTANAISLVTVTILLLRANSPSDMNACIKATSAYSPFFNDVPVSVHSVELNGTLFPGADPSWSRKPIGDPEAERKWDSYEPIQFFPLTRADVVGLGKTPADLARFPDELFHLGDEAYIGALDVEHKIHCLNELRKAAFHDYGDQSPAGRRNSQLWWVHLRHCMDMVTQDIICHADADVVTYNWRDTPGIPFPDFSVNRKCRNLDDLLEWRNARSVDVNTYVQIQKPTVDAANILPNDPEYYSLYGFEGSILFPEGKDFGPVPDIDFFGESVSD